MRIKLIGGREKKINKEEAKLIIEIRNEMNKSINKLIQKRKKLIVRKQLMQKIQ